MAGVKCTQGADPHEHAITGDRTIDREGATLRVMEPTETDTEEDKFSRLLRASARIAEAAGDVAFE
jgi:hypothetical protein